MIIKNKKAQGLSGLVGILLLITAVFIIAGILNEDFRTNYYETNITDVQVNDTRFEEQFVNITELNATFDPLIETIQDIETQEGFFDKLGDIAIAIPTLVIKLPGVLLAVLVSVKNATISTANFIGIPVVLIYIGTVGITIFFIFKIIEFWRRHPV